jgi:hypothetical protein
MDIQLLTWIMTTVGFIGFIFAGKKKWWAWYINLVVQILWALYALATGQPAFLASAVAYFVIFAVNAYKWTKDHLNVKKILADAEQNPGPHELPGGVIVTYDFGVNYPDIDGAVFQQDIEQIAKTCHETNRVLQIANEEDFISPKWEAAPDWQKLSALAGVRKALDGETPRQLHISWMEQKVADGWVYGPVKDSENKTHPCLVAYADLPLEQKVKDQMFYTVVNSFIQRRVDDEADTLQQV